MRLISLPSTDPNRWEGSNIFFLHNWRCAGSSMTSLLSSNFGSSYIKIGHPFSTFGWPKPYEINTPQITNLRQIKSKLKPGCIVGGHLFNGLEGLLPGRWDLWMNARHPVDRVSSGLLRFHSQTNQAATHRKDDLMQKSMGLQTKEDVAALLKGPLKREVNGLSRRLAGLAIADNAAIDSESNLEKVDFLEKNYSQEKLFDVALQQLSLLKLLIVPSAFQASVLCIEAAYDLEPIINPFSNLKHNPIDLGKSNDQQRQLIQSLRPNLEKAMACDMELWKHINRLFQGQIKQYKVSKKMVKVREIIHREALIDPQWLAEEGMTQELFFKGLAGRIAQRAVEAEALGPLLIETVCRWPRLNQSMANEISDMAMKAWNRSTN